MNTANRRKADVQVPVRKANKRKAEEVSTALEVPLKKGRANQQKATLNVALKEGTSRGTKRKASVSHVSVKKPPGKEYGEGSMVKKAAAKKSTKNGKTQ